MKHAPLAALAAACLVAAGLLLSAPQASTAADAAKDKAAAPKKDAEKKKLPAKAWREVADPLHIAAFENDLGTMKKLLSAKTVDVNVRLDFRTFPQYTPLHLAAHEGHSKIVDMLVAKKADLNLVEKNNKRTALHLAAFNGHVAVVRSLIKGGADLELKDKFQNTALKLASDKAIIAELTRAAEKADKDGAAKPAK